MLETRGDSVGDSLRLPPRGPSFVMWGWTSEPAVLGAGSSQPGHISSGHAIGDPSAGLGQGHPEL